LYETTATRKAYSLYTFKIYFMITLCLILAIWDKSFGKLRDKIGCTIIVIAIDSIYILPYFL